MDLCISSLSPGRRKLVEVMRQLHFGRIENLVVKNGDPAFDPRTRITQEIKLGPEAVARTVGSDTDFALKRQVLDLFDRLGELDKDSMITIEVRHGLPSRLVVERTW
jgi:hypothetical protein